MSITSHDRFNEDNELRNNARRELLEELVYNARGLTKKAFFSDKEITLVRNDDWQGQLVVKWDDVIKILEK